MNQDNGTPVNPGSIEYSSIEYTCQDATSGHDGHDGPHECEFCSPEPELIPAPWEREPGEGASGERDAMSAAAPAEWITQVWT
jgi:hypothetical protein